MDQGGKDVSKVLQREESIDVLLHAFNEHKVGSIYFSALLPQYSALVEKSKHVGRLLTKAGIMGTIIDRLKTELSRITSRSGANINGETAVDLVKMLLTLYNTSQDKHKSELIKQWNLKEVAQELRGHELRLIAKKGEELYANIHKKHR